MIDMEVIKMKVCNVCGQEKPLSEFYAGANTKDGHFGKCKLCTNAKTRAYAAKKRNEKAKRCYWPMLESY